MLHCTSTVLTVDALFQQLTKLFTSKSLQLTHFHPLCFSEYHSWDLLSSYILFLTSVCKPVRSVLCIARRIAIIPPLPGSLEALQRTRYPVG